MDLTGFRFTILYNVHIGSTVQSGSGPMETDGTAAGNSIWPPTSI